MVMFVMLTLFGSSWYPGSQEDCLDFVCGESRECNYVEGKGDCQIDAPTCASSKACSYAGHCTDAGEIYCRATSQAMCTASTLCKKDGLCRFEAAIVTDGRVTRAARCAPTNMMSCRRSQACKRYGRCTYTGGGCSITSDADCREGKACKTRGECSFDYAEGGYAITRCTKRPRDPDDPDTVCYGSTACNAYAACTWDGTVCASEAAPKQACSRYETIPIKSIGATSTHDPIPGVDFGVASLTDDDPRTSWQPAPNYKGGRGARIEVVFEAPVAVARLRIRNGFQRKDAKWGDLFTGNNRVALLALWRGSKGELAIVDGDAEVVGDGGEDLRTKWFVMALDHRRPKEQIIELHRDKLGEVTLELGAIAFGTTWNDLAISDLRFERCVD